MRAREQALATSGGDELWDAQLKAWSVSAALKRRGLSGRLTDDRVGRRRASGKFGSYQPRPAGTAPHSCPPPSIAHSRGRQPALVGEGCVTCIGGAGPRAAVLRLTARESRARSKRLEPARRPRRHRGPRPHPCAELPHRSAAEVDDRAACISAGPEVVVHLGRLRAPMGWPPVEPLLGQRIRGSRFASASSPPSSGQHPALQRLTSWYSQCLSPMPWAWWSG